ncbi:MAG: efflux RND transporter periplasmic adaptor subunit [Alphaproteobacteria bacterium]
MFKKILFLLALGAVGYVIAQRVFFGAPAGAPDMAAMGPAQVTVAAAVAREVREFREYSGRLRAVDSAEIRPRVEGVIDAVHFTEGAMVKKGDPLFTIDPRPYEAALSRATAALQSAQAQASYTKTDFERMVPLLKDSYVAKRDYDARSNAARVAAAELQAAEAAVRTAKLNLEFTHIAAPIDGRVSRAEITVGNFLQMFPNAPLLTSVVANTPIYVDFDMDEQTYLGYLQAGLTGNDMAAQIAVEVALTGDAGAVRKGFVKTFDNQMNAGSGTVRVRAQLDNPDGAMIPGMFAKIRVAVPHNGPMVLVADRAIGTDQDRKTVLFVGADNMVMPREVKLGGVVDGMRIILSGLKAGEKIVVNGLQRVMPGAPVMPAEISMDQAKLGEAAAPPAAGAQ